MNTDYTKQAEDFLKETGTRLLVKFVKEDVYFPDDKEARDIFRITLRRKGKVFSFRFGQSTSNTTGTGSKPPRAYDVLACLTKSDPGTFSDFADEYGYNNDSIKAEKVYKAVCREWKGVERMFGDVIEKLQEIN